MTAVLTKSAEVAEQLQRLRDWFPIGSTVYTILRHVSRSGMQREIGVLAYLGTTDDGRPDFRHPNYAVSKVLGIPMATGMRDGVKVRGGGMDMGFHLAYELSSRIYRGGFGCIGKGCPSNDHANGDRDFTPHDDGTPRNSAEVGTDIPGKRAHRHYHKDGGYALRHEWL